MEGKWSRIWEGDLEENNNFFGYKLHIILAVIGLILDFELAPAIHTALSVGQELMEGYADLTAIGDKDYISASVSEQFAEKNIRLITLSRRNQKEQTSYTDQKLFNGLRQIVETVNGQLAEQFHIEKNYAHSFRGLCARLYSKLTGHTLCIYLNRLLGKPEFLQIKSLEFSN